MSVMGSKLLDPEERKRIDSALHAQIVETAIGEFKKLLGFTLADKRLSKESEEKLFIAGERLGLNRQDMEPVIEAELANTGAVRIADEPPPPPVAIAPVVAVRGDHDRGPTADLPEIAGVRVDPTPLTPVSAVRPRARGAEPFEGHPNRTAC